MDDVVANFQGLVIGGFIAVMVVSQLHRTVGAALGLIFWAAVAFVGTETYRRGGGIGLIGFRFPQPMFYGFCLLLASLNVAAAYSHYRSKQRQALRKKLHEEL